MTAHPPFGGHTPFNFDNFSNNLSKQRYKQLIFSELIENRGSSLYTKFQLFKSSLAFTMSHFNSPGLGLGYITWFLPKMPHREGYRWLGELKFCAEIAVAIVYELWKNQLSISLFVEVVAETIKIGGCPATKRGAYSYRRPYFFYNQGQPALGFCVGKNNQNS